MEGCQTCDVFGTIDKCVLEVIAEDKTKTTVQFVRKPKPASVRACVYRKRCDK